MKTHIYYRVNPKISKTPAVHSNNKLKLVEYALKSFKTGLGDYKADITVLYDSCPREYYELFQKYLPGHEEIILSGAGNQKSWQYQLDLIKNNKSDVVYLAEDDYYYKPGTMRKLADFLTYMDADFVTPYDHPDNYNLKMHEKKYEIINCFGQHYRTIGTTTNTFMAKHDTLLKVMPTLESFTNGNSDAGYWMGLTGHNLLSEYSHWSWRHGHWPQILKTLIVGGYKLWCPVPGFATHLESTCISPGMVLQ